MTRPLCLESAKLFGEREEAGPDLLAAAASDAFASMDETTDDQTEWQATKPSWDLQPSIIHPRSPYLSSPLPPGSNLS